MWSLWSMDLGQCCCEKGHWGAIQELGGRSCAFKGTEWGGRTSSSAFPYQAQPSTRLFIMTLILLFHSPSLPSCPGWKHAQVVWSFLGDKNWTRARSQWLTPVIQATWETELTVWGQPWPNSLWNPISKNNQNKNVTQAVEYLLCKYKDLSSNFNPTKKKKRTTELNIEFISLSYLIAFYPHSSLLWTR
jgi:hypothetical protein